MRTQFAGLAILLLIVSGCNPGTPGSGVAKTETREVDTFNEVSISGSAEVSIQVGGEQSIEVTLDDNLIDRVRTEVKDGKLKVSTKGMYSSKMGLQVKIVVPELEGLYGSGSLDAIVTDVDSSEFAAHISGSGTIRANGIAESVTVRISGSGDIDLKELSAANADVDISGSGKVMVHAKQEVTARISGSGEIDVYGNPPTIVRSISGSGDVRKIERDAH